MTHSVSFSIPFPSTRAAQIIADALAPEASQKIPKSSVVISVEVAILKLKIGAEDVSSLRAACNSYLRWIQTAISVQDLI